MTKVLALDPIREEGLSLLRDAPHVELVHLPEPTEEMILDHLQDADAVILRARRLSESAYRSAPRLRLVSRHGVGCDNIDFNLMTELGIGVAIASDSNLVSVAEHAMALTLGACKNIGVATEAVRSGDWTVRDSLGARDLEGADTLVVGFGRIGRAYAARAAAFGARLSIYDPFMPVDAPLPEGMARVDDLATALETAEVISIHMPRTEQTAGLFGHEVLGKCRPGAILVNTARGGIVDERALVSALEAGRPGFYATDVLDNEPPSLEDPLLGRSDVLVTPHSAAMTRQGAIRMATRSAQNVLDYLGGTLSPDMMALPPKPWI